MIFIGFIPAVIGEKAIGQTVRLPMFLDAITASAMIGTAYFGTNALSYIRTIHLVSSLSSLLSASQNKHIFNNQFKSNPINQIIITAHNICDRKTLCGIYLQALQLEARLLIDCLVKEIILYDDKIEIKLNSPLPPDPWKPTKDYFARTEKEHDESHGFFIRNISLFLSAILTAKSLLALMSCLR